MQDQNALHALIINSLEEQIAVIDKTGTIIYVNPAWEKFGAENGFAAENSGLASNYLEVLKSSIADGDDLASEVAQGISDVVNNKRESFHFEYPCHSPGEQRWFMMRIAHAKDESRELFVISHNDITLRKLAEMRAEHLALHDPLTGLANRRYFSQFLNEEIRRCVRYQLPVSLIEVDVDHFKELNDELGHLAGDECLVRISQILQDHSCRAGDMAARLGGDEFALILGDTDSDGAQLIAESILKKVNDLQIFFAGSKQITVSLGVATTIAHEQLKTEHLLQESDKALYEAKSAGRNQIMHA
jgi:diguanylate cyclase (GGDEF)-like protein/PAS domain S-box-containing protein